MSPPVCVYSNSTSHSNLYTDGCSVQIRCVFLQQQEDRTTNPMCNWPRSSTGAERKYDTTQQEYPAFIWAVHLLRPYLEGITFTIWMAHILLKRILKLTKKYVQTGAHEFANLMIRFRRSSQSRHEASSRRHGLIFAHQ